MDKGADEFSAIRLALLLWVVGVLMVWIYASWKAGTLQAIPESVITILGLLAGGKAVQRFGEKVTPYARLRDDGARTR
jgi:hypothetical protein